MHWRLLGLATLWLATAAMALDPQALRGGSTPSLLETVKSHPDLFGFKSLLKTADLEAVLSGSDALTVFAPSDVALNRVPSAVFRRLQDNPTQLRRVLVQHVVRGNMDRKALGSTASMELASMLDEAHPLYTRREVREEGMWPLKKKVTELWVASRGGFSGQLQGERRCSNGIVHVIDTILLPDFPEDDEWFKATPPKWTQEDPKAPEQRSLLEEMLARPELSVFAALVQETGVLQGVSAEKLTVFAPTNAAFAKLPAGMLDFLRQLPGALAKIVKYHIAPGSHCRFDLASLFARGVKLQSLLGREEQAEMPLAVGREGRDILIVDADGKRALATPPDVKAVDGMLHTIDAVLGLADEGRPSDAKLAKLLAA